MKLKRAPQNLRHAGRQSPFRQAARLTRAVACVFAVAACAPVPSGPPTSAQKEAFGDQARGVLQTMRACDQAAGRAGVGEGQVNYEAALSAQAECARTANTLQNFRFDVGQQFQQPLDGAMSACWAAYDAKARRLARLAMTINGVAKADPSQANDDADSADDAAKACKADLMRKAHGLGFDTGGLSV